MPRIRDRTTHRPSVNSTDLIHRRCPWAASPHLTQRQQPRILQSRRTMPQPRQIPLMPRKSQKRLHRLLPNQQRPIPPFPLRTDQPGPARRIQQNLTATLLQKRKRMRHIPLISLRPADRLAQSRFPSQLYSQFRVSRVIRHLTESQQIQHHHRRLHPALHQRPPRRLRRTHIAFHSIAPFEAHRLRRRSRPLVSTRGLRTLHPRPKLTLQKAQHHPLPTPAETPPHRRQ